MTYTRKDIQDRFGNQFLLDAGLTSAKLRGKELRIEHRGNMGTPMEEIDKNLYLMGLPIIRDLKDSFPLFHEKGSPDYFYQIRFTMDK